ncbi:MAG: hypothetical protein ABI137_08870 [Antricoccus sp.]
MPNPVNPALLSTSFVAFDENPAAQVVVRRIRRDYFIRGAWLCALVALLPFAVPLLVREPRYFVNGMLIVAAILALLLFVAGLAGSYLWSHTGIRKGIYFGPVLTADTKQLTLHSSGTGLPEVSIGWKQLIRVRPVDRAKTKLAFTVEPLRELTQRAAEDAVPPHDEDSTTATWPEDEVYTPPPPSVATTEDFAAIEPLTASSAEPLDQQPQRPTSSPGPWQQTMYGTPYVVSFRNCDKSAQDVLKLLAQLRTP